MLKGAYKIRQHKRGEEGKRQVRCSRALAGGWRVGRVVECERIGADRLVVVVAVGYRHAEGHVAFSSTLAHDTQLVLELVRPLAESNPVRVLARAASTSACECYVG